MARDTWRTTARWGRWGCAVVGLGLATLGCGAPAATDGGRSGDVSAPATDVTQLIEHLVPKRDAVGPAPTRFEWTPVSGADRYAIGVWDDVDRLRWRKDDVATASVATPADLVLEAGTFFWTVSALQHGREIARSGLAAFVVEE